MMLLEENKQLVVIKIMDHISEMIIYVLLMNFSLKKVVLALKEKDFVLLKIMNKKKKKNISLLKDCKFFKLKSKE